MLDTQNLQASVNSVVEVGVWHMRLGQPSYLRLDVISEDLGTTKLKNKDSICNRRNIHIYCSLTFTIFELLHIDIWGPFSVETIDGYKTNLDQLSF